MTDKERYEIYGGTGYTHDEWQSQMSMMRDSLLYGGDSMPAWWRSSIADELRRAERARPDSHGLFNW